VRSKTLWAGYRLPCEDPYAPAQGYERRIGYGRRIVARAGRRWRIALLVVRRVSVQTAPYQIRL